MDNQTLEKVQKISELLYTNNVHYFILFNNSYIRIITKKLYIKLTYKKWRDVKTFNYSIYDKYNKDKFDFKDFRLVMKKLNEYMYYLKHEVK